MAKKTEKPEKPAAPQSSGASAGIKKRLDEKDNLLTYIPDQVDRVIRKYTKRRADEMMDYRKALGIEQRWQEADEEYIPHELDFGTTRKRFETDQDTGLRSRMVPVGDVTQQWRQASSAPTLLAKIQTAISIIIDQMPEADLVALQKKYEKSTDIAYALWKRNWQITDAKEKLKLVIFDLIKYGWAAQRTYPRNVTYDKQVLVEKDMANPENDRYESKKLTWFNDIDRQRLDPFRTWIDEMATPYDQYSMNECYYELDFSYDAAEIEFGKYPNWKYVKHDSVVIRNDQERKSNRKKANEDARTRKDIVTVGFFESRHKDMFVVKAVKDDIILYASPLPNDDGYLSVTHGLWLIRKSGMPYGISLWEIIRQNKALYDKMKNMGMDQLVLSIMKFGFFAGTSTALGDGKIEIVPGQARQMTSSSGKPEVSWMEIPGPGQDFWTGLEALAKMMDDESGITPTMEGDITGKTLGEILHAKEAALKRLKTPVENIAWMIEQDAYITLSWMSQVYAVPTVKDFTTADEMTAFEQEEDMNHSELFGTIQNDEQGNQFVGAPYQAHYLPQLSLHLEDSDGKLTASNKSKFFQVGSGDGDIKPNQLKWRGIFKVIPRSIIDSSQELMKAMTMEMFNMLIPLLQFPPELVAKPAREVLKINEQDFKDWLPDAWIQYLEQGPAQPGQPAPGQSVFTPGGQGAAPQPGAPAGAPPAPPGAVPGAGGMQMPAPGMKEGQTIQGGTGMTPPQAATIVPGGPGPTIAQLAGGKFKGVFGRGL